MEKNDGGWYMMVIEEDKDKIQVLLRKKNKNMTLIYDLIAKQLIDKYIFKTISSTKYRSIYLYKEGIYVEEGRDVIEKECERVFGIFSKTNMINEVRAKIERLTLINREMMGCKDINLICCRNGVLNLKTKELLKFSPDYFL